MLPPTITELGPEGPGRARGAVVTMGLERQGAACNHSGCLPTPLEDSGIAIAVRSSSTGNQQ